MYRLSPQLLIAAAGTMVSMGVDAEAAFGETMDRKTKERRGGDASWDVQFIERCGYWSHYDYRSGESAWPFPRGMSLNELALYAKAHGAIHDAPEWGDVFLMYSGSRKEFVHAGIVLSATERGRYTPGRSYVDVYTIEGDTDANSLLNGGRVMRVNRRLLPWEGDVFVRWTSLPTRERPAGGMAYLASILDQRRVS